VGEFVDPCELLASTKRDHIASGVRATLWYEPFLECYWWLNMVRPDID
jgi:hypothetical protein